MVSIEDDPDWHYVVNEDFVLDFFTDFDFVRCHAAGIPRSMVLAAVREPTVADIAAATRASTLPGAPQFQFAGFDIVDKQGGISVLLDCGGFPEVFSPIELSAESGLIPSLERAYEIRDTLCVLHPDNPHTNCHVWAVWSYTGEA